MKRQERPYHFHVVPLAFQQLNLDHAKIVNKADADELLRRYMTEWLNPVAVWPCEQPTCGVGDIGG